MLHRLGTSIIYVIIWNVSPPKSLKKQLVGGRPSIIKVCASNNQDMVLNKVDHGVAAKPGFKPHQRQYYIVDIDMHTIFITKVNNHSIFPNLGET